MTQARVTVWYDGNCPLCLREIALMRRLDTRRAIHFIDAASPDSTCPIDRADILARFHAQERDQPIVSGAAAFVAMWRAIPLLRPFGLLAHAPGGIWLLERVYRQFLRFRPRLQSVARRLWQRP